MQWRLMLKAACAAALVVGPLALAAQAVDQLNKRRVGDQEGSQLRGTISSISPEEVAIKDTKGVETRVPVDEIESIRFENEPKTMFLARNAALAGRLEDGARMFKEIADSEVANFEEAKNDKEFYIAYCAVKLAMTGASDAGQAQKLLEDFAKAHPSSYHFLEANQLLGDLLAANAKYPEAEKAYAKLAESNVLGYKMSGSVAKGHAMLQQKNVPEALKVFESVLAMGNPDKTQDAQQRYAANLGKASCLAASGKQAEAIKLIETVIDKAEENDALYAKAYNTLGGCYNASQNHKEALLAYLKVDVIYFNSPTEHAEALANLVSLWKKLDTLPNAKERSADCLTRLKARYPTSAWVKVASGG